MWQIFPNVMAPATLKWNNGFIRIFIISLALIHRTQGFTPTVKIAATGSLNDFTTLNVRRLTMNQSLRANPLHPPSVPLTRSHHAVTKISHLGMGNDSTDRSFITDGLATISSTSSLILIDIAFRRLLKSLSISFPSSLAGCGALLVSLLAASAIKDEWGDFLYGLLAPGAGLLAKWLPIFFVPSLVTLPLAQSLGSGVEVSILFLMIFQNTLSHT